VLTLKPAYGRNYKSKSAVVKDFNDNKDFVICQYGHRYDGKPVNKKQLSGETVHIRYDSDRKVAVVKVI
jgi:hypothetical protein